MGEDRIEEILGSTYLFQEAKGGQVQKLATISNVVEFPSGTAIIKEGEKGDSLFILFDGEITISKTLTLLKEGELGAGEKTITKLQGKSKPFFGEGGLLGAEERSATVIAVSPCRLIEIKSPDFHRVCSEDHELGFLIYRRLTSVLWERLRKTTQDVLKLSTALSLALER